jgi:chromatin segregation and condensation protein Rec8/ScpA/Scc1 (kleisin family)
VWLGRAAERRAQQFARGYMPPAPALPPPPLTLNLLDMLTAVERVIAGIPSPVLHKVIARPLDVESATRRIEELLRDQERIHWIDALGSDATIVDVLSTLLALLELAKRGSLRLLQPTPFSPLVTARESARATA